MSRARRFCRCTCVCYPREAPLYRGLIFLNRRCWMWLCYQELLWNTDEDVELTTELIREAAEVCTWQGDTYYLVHFRRFPAPVPEP